MKIISRTRMKNTAIAALVVILSSFSIYISETTRLNVESNHSTIQFYVPISNGITRISGKFTEYSMDIEYDSINFVNSKIAVVIKASSINTGIEGRDDHLRTADFLDTETYPEITFISETITANDDGSYQVEGNFSMHGITKKISMPLTITGKAGKYTVGFSSRLSLNRMDYGVGADFKHSSMENFIGEDIAVEINFWTKKWKEKKKEKSN